MARYTAVIDTPRPPQEAFEYLADLRNFERWDPGVSSSRQVEGDGPGPGAAYDVKANGVDLTYRTEEYDPGRMALVVARTRALASKDRIVVEDRSEGSRVTYDAELTFRGPLGLFDPLLGVVFNRIAGKAADGLTGALDGQRVA
ncbi:MAG: SRPBCC family protein [Acidimicrobiales bacterium]